MKLGAYAIRLPGGALDWFTVADTADKAWYKMRNTPVRHDDIENYQRQGYRSVRVTVEYDEGAS